MEILAFAIALVLRVTWAHEVTCTCVFCRLGTSAEYTFYATLLTMLQQVVRLVTDLVWLLQSPFNMCFSEMTTLNLRRRNYREYMNGSD